MGPGLVDDPLLKKRRIVIDVERIKNFNKNPVTERAIKKVEEVIQPMKTHKGPSKNYITLILVTFEPPPPYVTKRSAPPF